MTKFDKSLDNCTKFIDEENGDTADEIKLGPGTKVATTALDDIDLTS